MKYKLQLQVLEKLEDQTRKALRKIEDQRAAEFVKLWHDAKLDLAASIMREYHQDFPRGSWDIVQANNRGTLRRMRVAVTERLGHFRNEAANLMTKSLRELYKAEIERGLWMLDQVTPGNVIAVRPLRAHESAAPQDYAAGWKDALDGWVQSFEDTLAANLRLEALHEGSIDDAADEVDAAKIGNSVPSNKFQSLFTNQSLIVMQEARDDLSEANDDMVAEEIWMTMEDTVVCPICNEYDGHPYSEVDDEIPAHFNCRCYTRIVPASWAALLRSGNQEDRDTALAMDDKGLVPSSMAILDDDGSLTATSAVSFDNWTQGRGQQLYGTAIRGAVK